MCLFTEQLIDMVMNQLDCGTTTVIIDTSDLTTITNIVEEADVL